MKKKIEVRVTEIVDLVFFILLSIISIIQLIPLQSDESNNCLKMFYWLLFCSGCLVLLFLLFVKIKNTLFKNNWIQCENFPNEERICTKVRELINDDRFVQEIKRKSFDLFETVETKLYQEFLNVIMQFFLLSRKNCIMTLPYDPYNQIKTNEKRITLENSLDSISTTQISKNEKVKVIALSNDEFEKFKSNLIEDFKTYGLKKLKIKDYISKHKKRINLFWMVNPDIAIEEFIIIDDSVDISVSESEKKIQVDFNRETINRHKTKFKEISTSKKSTKDFFKDKILVEEVLDKFDFKEGEQKKFIKLFS